MSKVLSALVGVSMVGLAGVTNAAEPVTLTDVQMDNVTAGTVTLYEHTLFGGARMTLYGADDNLNINLMSPGVSWNDQVSSIVVEPGTSATFYEHTLYMGRSWTLPGGEYPWVEAVGIPNDVISSVKLN